MKKFLIGSIAFFLFSISISILQTSCDKEADAAPDGINASTQLGKIFWVKNNGIWSANYDGSNQTRINVSMPAGYIIYYLVEGPKVSPDGKKLFFLGMNTSTEKVYVYGCNIDGTNVIQLVDLGVESRWEGSFGGAY